MKGYVGNTDYDWYEFLRAQGPLDEVNFWQPSGGRKRFLALEPGEPFFFRLKAPHHAICGYGRFARHEQMVRTSIAWKAFGEKNGAPDLAQMRERVRRYRATDERDPEVGCLMISEPVFFAPDAWVSQPPDWPANAVEGKTYSLDALPVRRMFEACLARSRPSSGDEAFGGWLATDRERYGAPQVVRPRLGQGAFQVAIVSAYGGACAVSGEHSRPVLDAAHIRPYSEQGTHEVSNGLLLRTDIHRLFDDGYVTITPAHRFEVSRRLKDEFDNGKTYYALHGQPVRIPARAADRPSPEALRWHNEVKFNG